MQPKTVVDKPVREDQLGDRVVYRFEFEQTYCGWDALHIMEFEGITFPENRRFAWCGPRVGLTPSNRRENKDTIFELPREAVAVAITGHAANQHYRFLGWDEPIQALDATGKLLDEGTLDPWFSRNQNRLILKGAGIKRIRLPASKPVFFLRHMEVRFRGRSD